jgi:alanyl-tRNA synthetase
VAKERVAGVLKQEEEKFAETLEHGMVVLDGAMRGSGGDRILDGETVFRLYDTFGFPLDLTADVARERGFNVDFAGFEHAMQMQRERARAANKFQMGQTVKFEGQPTEFQGYDTLDFSGRVLALYKEGAQVSGIQAGDAAVVVLDHTPFYAESGGQVGDRGELHSPDGTFTVDDTQKIQAEVFGHKGVLKIGTLSVGDTVEAHVDPVSRQRVVWNHSATHLLHAALRKVLGNHVMQKGSLVDAQRTRFDFSHPQPMTAEEIQKIETLVNQAIRANHAVEVRRMKYDQAIKHGAMALFGEKYGDEVRVIGIGDFSTELCGGTHVKRSGDIGLFKIVSEGGVAAGIRRIEAVTGDGALDYIQHQQQTLLAAAGALKAQPQEINQKITQMLDSVKSLEKELARLKSKLAAAQGDDLSASAVDVKGAKVLAAEIDGADAKALRETLDKLKDKLGSAAIVLASREGGKVTLIAGVTADLTDRVKAGELVNHVATQCGGKGGGRPDMAQAGGTLPDNLPKALASVAEWVGGKV